MTKHYTTEELELYRNHQMSVLGRINCSSHLKNCPECAKRLEELQADDELIRQLRDSIKIYGELSQTKCSHSTTSLSKGV